MLQQRPERGVALLERPTATPDEALIAWIWQSRAFREGWLDLAEGSRLRVIYPGRRWGGPALHVLPGLGICAPDALGEIRHLIEEGEILPHAA